MSSNNVAIVTGASRGIGKAVSLHLISKGVSVVGVARSADALSSTSEEINKAAANGVQFIPVVGDVTDEAVQQSAVDQAAKHGTLVALVNNAGVVDPIGPIASTPISSWVALFQTNFFASFSLIQKALPLLRPVNGRIINLSSSASYKFFHEYAVYGAAKAAVNYATLVLGAEEPEITAVAIHPGVVETPMFDRVVGHAKESTTENSEEVLDIIFSAKITTELPGAIIGNLALRADHSLSGKYVEYDQPEIAEYANIPYLLPAQEVTEDTVVYRRSWREPFEYDIKVYASQWATVTAHSAASFFKSAQLLWHVQPQSLDKKYPKYSTKVSVKIPESMLNETIWSTSSIYAHVFIERSDQFTPHPN
ncbi:NAD(P)-binding protein, partial [Martensiomyces pterosporus]